MEEKQLKDTAWLAKRLNLSETTIERLRVRKSSDIPPHLTIGRSIRYDVNIVENWLISSLKTREIQNDN